LGSNSQEKELIQIIIRVINEEKPETVKQLAQRVREKSPFSEKEIIKTVLKLQSNGRIELGKHFPLTPPKITAYLKTEHALWYWATMATAIATVAAVFTIPEHFFPLVYIRYVLGSIFVLWLPGYTFIKALFPLEPPLKTSQRSLDTIERIALSLGMSLALVPIVGLMLNYTPWGIRLTPIVLSLLALTVIFATAAIIREHQAKSKTEDSKPK